MCVHHSILALLVSYRHWSINFHTLRSTVYTETIYTSHVTKRHRVWGTAMEDYGVLWVWDSVGIPTGFSVGMGIEIRSPRQPCELPFRLSDTTIHVITTWWKARLCTLESCTFACACVCVDIRWLQSPRRADSSSNSRTQSPIATLQLAHLTPLEKMWRQLVQEQVDAEGQRRRRDWKASSLCTRRHRWLVISLTRRSTRSTMCSRGWKCSRPRSRLGSGQPPFRTAFRNLRIILLVDTTPTGGPENCKILCDDATLQDKMKWFSSQSSQSS